MGLSIHRKEVVFTIAMCLIGAMTYVYAQDTINNKNAKNVKNPSLYNDILPENIRMNITSAERLSFIIVDSWIENDSVKCLWGHPLGEILTSKSVEDSLLTENITELLISPTSFSNDSIVKESTFMPDFGVMFMSSTDTVLVSYSLYCDVCRFQTPEGIWDYNGSNIRKGFILNLKKVFPNDKFVRNISKRL